MSVNTKSTIKLGQYKGLTLPVIKIQVTEEEVQAEVENIRKANTEEVVVDRAAEMGDTVVIAYDGSIDGVPFEGGKSDEYPLVLGSHSFIEGFEDQLVGGKAGDDVDVHVSFPEEYHAADLSGKPALFKVKIHSVKGKNIPELDNEFVAKISEAKTVSEFMDMVKHNVNYKKQEQAEIDRENHAIEVVMNDSEFELVESEIEDMTAYIRNQFEANLSRQGLNFDLYCQLTGTDSDEFVASMRPTAEQNCKVELILDAISEAEEIAASEEDKKNYFEQIAVAYGVPVEEVLKNFADEEKLAIIAHDITRQKAMRVMIESAKAE